MLQLRLSGQCWELTSSDPVKCEAGQVPPAQVSPCHLLPLLLPCPAPAPLQCLVQEQDWSGTPSWSRCGAASENLRALQEIWDYDALNKLQLQQHPYILLDFVAWVTLSLRLSPSKLWRHSSLTTDHKLAKTHLQKWRTFLFFFLQKTGIIYSVSNIQVLSGLWVIFYVHTIVSHIFSRVCVGAVTSGSSVCAHVMPLRVYSTL